MAHQHYPGCSLYLNRWLAWCPITGKTAIVPAAKREKNAKEGAIVGMVNKPVVGNQMVSGPNRDRSVSLLSSGVGQPSSLYLASTFESKLRLRPMRDALVRMGYVVTSTWLEQELSAPVDPLSPTGHAGTTDEQAHEYAVRDLDEILRADGLILDTLETNQRGGREFEAGYAAGHGLPVWIVGPNRNVFHTQYPHFSTWEECLAYFKDRSYGGRS